eukprot:TRINITY_DN816_c2_g1_i2.p1 TRINITY_DN816_c2_g1~~TRINITY_DN816_c2_g1_i2.p1  ORF type:complete len:1396 (+),score=380.02 TRINITY_DN816_c2_g1_i2:115-4188(+)
MANMEVFERYFQQADADGDGRISGQEAVRFFQLFGLPQGILATIWQYADSQNAGFLLRPGFFNALKLVTVAQAGKQLTADLVRAALTGPAASQIPPPQMVGSAPPGGRPNQGPPPGAPAPGGQGPPSSQRGSPSPTGYGQVPPPNQMMPPGSQRVSPAASGYGPISPPNQMMPPGGQPMHPGQMPGAAQRSPPGSMYGQMAPPRGQGQPPASQMAFAGLTPQFPSSTARAAPSPTGPPGSLPPPSLPPPNSQPTSSIPPFNNTSGLQPPISSTSPTPSFAPSFPVAPLQARPAMPSASPPSSVAAVPPPSAPSPQAVSSTPALPSVLPSSSAANGSASIPPSVAAPTPAPSATQAPPGVQSQGGVSTKAPLSEDLFGGDMFASSRVVPPTAPRGAPGLVAPGSGPTGGGAPPPQQISGGPPRVASTGPAAIPAPGAPSSPPSQPSAAPTPAPEWPLLRAEEVQRYQQVFEATDKDRDGQITGMEARTLFLGYGMPREVLKQVWDLSDTGKDGKLSRREFYSAMYLIDRLREGKKLPARFPPGVHLDEQQQAGTGLPGPPPGGVPGGEEGKAAAWRLSPGALSAAPSSGPGPASAVPQQTAVGQMPTAAGDGSAAVTGTAAYVSRVPTWEAGKVKQLEKGEQENLQSRRKDAEAADRKVWTTESELLDSKQKIEFYRTKMQEIIIFKSKCDNRLNEITERAAAEKRELEQLAKKYDEKYKQTEGVVSRLAFEDLALKDIQEKKLELHAAVTRMEQGAPSNSRLQEMADKLASDLEELRKVVNKRAKQLGLTVRPILGSDEVPFGWQGGLQENAVEWDDEWHEFVDEGFAAVEDLGDEVGPLDHALLQEKNDPFKASGKLPLPAGEFSQDGSGALPVGASQPLLATSDQSQQPSAQGQNAIEVNLFGDDSDTFRAEASEQVLQQQQQNQQQQDLQQKQIEEEVRKTREPGEDEEDEEEEEEEEEEEVPEPETPMGDGDSFWPPRQKEAEPEMKDSDSFWPPKSPLRETSASMQESDSFWPPKQASNPEPQDEPEESFWPPRKPADKPLVAEEDAEEESFWPPKKPQEESGFRASFGDAKLEGQYGRSAAETEEYVESEEEGEPGHYRSAGGGVDASPNVSKRSDRYGGVVGDSLEFTSSAQPAYSSGNSTSFDNQPHGSSMTDAFSEGGGVGPSWSAAISRHAQEPNDDEAESGVRASWGLQSNPPSTHASLDFSNDKKGGVFGRGGFGDFGDSGRFEATKEEDGEGVGEAFGGTASATKSATNGKEGGGTEEGAGDNDPFSSLFKRGDSDRSSFDAFSSWGTSGREAAKPTTVTHARAGFGSFSDDKQQGFGSSFDDVEDSRAKATGAAEKPAWSAFE